ncbi:sensor histidine kinase [Egbenema bharatensis]|uniref:sensor histidine kinase n=1 Tax=Egbenema bharatensis TaxID=3463334 RepID=UPI003A86DD34
MARTSHELRSPINSVISLHQLILADLCEDPAEEREFVSQANTAAQKMLSLMDQLIKVAKVSYGSGQINLSSLCLLDVLLEVHQFTHLQAQNRNLRLNIEFPDEAVTVLSDSDWLRQILVSLIDSSIALMQEGTIRVTTGMDTASGLVQIWIEDERSPDSWQEPIDLLKADASDSTHPAALRTTQTIEELKTELNQPPSPGLVLLVSQKLLERMGGRLELLSTPSTPSLTRIQCSIPIASSVA